MPLPFDVINTVGNERKANRRSVQQNTAEISAILGNEQNVWNVPGKNGNEVYVRLLGNTESENATYQPSTTAFVRGNYFEYAGSPVLLKYNKHGALVLIDPDETQVAQAGDQLSMSALNSGSKQSKFLNLDNVLRLISRPVSRGSTNSLLVSVSQFIYDHYGNYITFNGTPLQADKINLSAFMPASGEHVVVQLWLDTFNNTIQTTTSTAQALTVDIVNADYQEAWLGSNRYQDWLPLQAYILKDNAATITQKELGRDNRQFINTPDELGNETTLTINTRIRSDRQWSVDNNLTIPTGYTLAIETGGSVVIDKHISNQFYHQTRVTVPTYTTVPKDRIIKANTDNNAIVVTLQAGALDRRLRIVNTGTSNNNLTITPNGSENLIGENLSFVLLDGEALIIDYEPTDGWY